MQILFLLLRTDNGTYFLNHLKGQKHIKGRCKTDLFNSVLVLKSWYLLNLIILPRVLLYICPLRRQIDDGDCYDGEH